MAAGVERWLPTPSTASSTRRTLPFSSSGRGDFVLLGGHLHPRVVRHYGARVDPPEAGARRAAASSYELRFSARPSAGQLGMPRQPCESFATTEVAPTLRSACLLQLALGPRLATRSAASRRARSQRGPDHQCGRVFANGGLERGPAPFYSGDDVLVGRSLIGIQPSPARRCARRARGERARERTAVPAGPGRPGSDHTSSTRRARAKVS